MSTEVGKNGLSTSSIAYIFGSHVELKFMPKKYLIKSDFSRWITCPTAAHYGWSDCESKNDDDAFLKFLEKEGQTVGLMAQRLFANGVLMEKKNPERVNQMTMAQLEQDCTLFESCIITGDFVIRPDVLIRKGGTLYIIEVKSKNGNLRQHREGKMLINCYGDVRAAYREIVYDLAFQVEVLKRAFPNLTVIPFFLLPEEQARACQDEVMAAREREEIALFELCEEIINKRRSESVLKFFPASTAIERIQIATSATMDSMALAWKSGQRPEPQLRYGCRNCVFRLKGDNTDGFHKCWGKLSESTPHLFDLHQLYSLKMPENKQALLADEKIRAGTTSLFDVEENELHGEHANRQRIQLECQGSGNEWIDPQLREEIEKLQWPIAFVDFETTMSAIPWHPGLKPYETLPFQFSAHILHEDGSFEHREWLNTEDRVPTLPFIKNLRSALDGVGSVLVYTDYENRILTEAIGLLNRLHHVESKEEREWIADLLNSDRIIDQHDWVHRFYFHPQMGGRTSIKVVLPAIWKNNLSLHSHDYFKRYYSERDGEILDPYSILPSADIDGRSIEVREGCGAMQAYREMIIGRRVTRPKKKEIATLLCNYVTLDTASQWIIFEHWRQHFSEYTEMLGTKNEQ
ncbi:MAG: DUF2779 domain-containing protein [Opitutaceae bacterium]